MDKDIFIEGNLPSYREADCGKQDNGYDCGIFTINYIAKAIKHIGNKEEWRNMITTPEEANVLRTIVLSYIELEIIRHNNENGIKQKNVEKVKNDNEITMGKEYKGSGNGRSTEKEDINNNENIKGNNMTM